MLDIIVAALAAFWAWETVRYSATRFIPRIFDATRPAHPALVAAFTLAILWPEWVEALAAAATVGILHQVVEHFAGGYGTSVALPTRRRGNGLPPLP